MLTDHRKVVAWLAWALDLLCVALASGTLLLWLLNGRAPIAFVREGDAAVVVLEVRARKFRRNDFRNAFRNDRETFGT